MLVVVPVIRLIYWQYVPGMHDVMDRRFETVANALATGCVLAGLQGWLPKQKRFNAFLRFPGFYVMPLVPYLTYVAIADRPRTFYGAGITLANLSIAICIDRWVRYPQGVGGALLNSKPLRWVGLLSYSIYLWQQPFLNSEAAAFWNRIPLNLCLAALSVWRPTFWSNGPSSEAGSGWWRPNPSPLPPIDIRCLWPSPAADKRKYSGT